MKTSPVSKFAVILIASVAVLPAAEDAATLKQFCFQCHGKAAMGGLNLEQLTANAAIGDNFQHWEKVVRAIEQKRMPRPRCLSRLTSSAPVP